MRRVTFAVAIVASWLVAAPTASAVPIEVERKAKKQQVWCNAPVEKYDSYAGHHYELEPVLNVTDQPWLILKCRSLTHKTVTKRWTVVRHVAPEPEPVYVAEPEPVVPAPAPPAPVESTGGGGWAIPESIVMCESGGDYNARNPSGAYGAYQIMPGTATAYGCDLSTASGQDECAARIWAGGSGRSHWVC